MLYGVVIFDIVGSRRISARNDLQKNLQKKIRLFNQKHSSMLGVPANITLGDEWQVLTHQPAKLYEITELFQQMFWPDQISLYAGMGIGTLSTALSQDIRNIDGSCFHYARKSLETVKKQNHRLSGSKRNKVFFSGGNTYTAAEQEIAATNESVAAYTHRITIEELINIMIENNEILKSKMTVTQKEIYLQYLQFGSYRKIIEKTDKKSIGNISERINSAEVFTIRRNGILIEKLLSYYCLEGRSGFNV